MRSVFASAKVRSAPQRRSKSPRKISCLSPHSLGCSMTGVSPTGSRRGLVRPPCTRIFAIICKPRLQCKEVSSLLKGDRCVPKEVCVLKSRLGTTGRGISLLAECGAPSTLHPAVLPRDGVVKVGSGRRVEIERVAVAVTRFVGLIGEIRLGSGGGRVRHRRRCVAAGVGIT
jgi:hypothetical protein